MAKFTTRVELYGKATWDDYEKLHSAMAKEGFSRTIKWENDDTIYQMPHAEYNRNAEMASDEVRDSAVKAAASVWKDFAVLVTMASGGRSQHNLKPT